MTEIDPNPIARRALEALTFHAITGPTEGAFTRDHAKALIDYFATRTIASAQQGPEIKGLPKDAVYYLGSIMGNLSALQAMLEGPTLGSEVVADNIDWLGDFIEFVRTALAPSVEAGEPMHLRGGFETEYGHFKSGEAVIYVDPNGAKWLGILGEVMPDGEADFQAVVHRHSGTFKWRFFRKAEQEAPPSPHKGEPSDDPTLKEAWKLTRDSLAYGIERARRDWNSELARAAAERMAKELLDVFDHYLPEHFIDRYASPPPVAEGMVLIPREPTGFMVRAGVDERDRPGSGASVSGIYRAMIAAAPNQADGAGE